MINRYSSCLVAFGILLNARLAIGGELDAFSTSLQAMLTSGEHAFLEDAHLQKEREMLAGLYESRQYKPLWTRNARPSPQAIEMLQILRTADTFGLRPIDYQGSAIAYQLIDLLSDAGADASRWAAVDLALSMETSRLVHDLHYGRVDPKAAGFDTPVMSPAHLDRAAVLSQLATAADTAAILASVEPAFHHYKLLKAALPLYRRLADEPELTRLPTLHRNSLAPGEQYDGAPALRRLLRALGDLPQATSKAEQEWTVDPALVDAIVRFQRRHGLRADGTIGKATFAALTTPLAQRARQIELTLERWRWLPSFDAPPIVVNIPQFRLFALHTTNDAESQMLQMDVIVGRTFQRMRTPVFSADMTYVVFRPYWEVPYNITSQELLPEIRAKPGYLATHNLEIVAARDEATPLPATAENLAALASGALRLRQRPGPDNSLGLVKFMLPNRYNVYLHSTPAVDLFNEPRRAFSHGCIRVSNPIALAEHILRDTPGEWNAERIRAAMNGTDTLRVNLTKPIPVMILYATAVAMESGDMLFFEDLYGHDSHLEALLGLPPIAN